MQSYLNELSVYSLKGNHLGVNKWSEKALEPNLDQTSSGR